MINLPFYKIVVISQKKYMSKIENHIERLNLLIKELNINRNKLAFEIGYKNVASLYRISIGEGKLTDGTIIERILKRYPFINRNFLLHGELPIKLSPEEQIIQNNLMQASKYPTLNEQSLANINQLLSLIRQDISELKKDVEEIKNTLKKQ